MFFNVLFIQMRLEQTYCIVSLKRKMKYPSTSKVGPLAQLEEHLTFNQVLFVNPLETSYPTISLFTPKRGCRNEDDGGGSVVRD